MTDKIYTLFISIVSLFLIGCASEPTQEEIARYPTLDTIVLHPSDNKHPKRFPNKSNRLLIANPFFHFFSPLSVEAYIPVKGNVKNFKTITPDPVVIQNRGKNYRLVPRKGVYVQLKDSNDKFKNPFTGNMLTAKSFGSNLYKDDGENYVFFLDSKKDSATRKSQVNQELAILRKESEARKAKRKRQAAWDKKIKAQKREDSFWANAAAGLSRGLAENVPRIQNAINDPLGEKKAKQEALVRQAEIKRYTSKSQTSRSTSSKVSSPSEGDLTLARTYKSQYTSYLFQSSSERDRYDLGYRPLQAELDRISSDTKRLQSQFEKDLSVLANREKELQKNKNNALAKIYNDAKLGDRIGLEGQYENAADVARAEKTERTYDKLIDAVREERKTRVAKRKRDLEGNDSKYLNAQKKLSNYSSDFKERKR